MATLHHRRLHGLFSNVSMLHRDICKAIKRGEEVDHISMVLTEYDQEADLYPSLFQINHEARRNLTLDDCKYLLAECPSDIYGLFNSRLDLARIGKVTRAFLQPSDAVMELSREIKKGLPGKYAFLWYRGTDKITENLIPTPDQFIDGVVAVGLKYSIPEIQQPPFVYRTDQLDFITAMENHFLSSIHLTTIRTSNDAAHLNLHLTGDAQFEAEHGMSKIKYLQHLIAITLVAAESTWYFATNSNINSYVLLQRGHFERQVIFKNDRELLFR